MVSIGTDLQQAAELLKSGQLVAIPTETVYGLAGNALSEEAVLNIFRVKNRPAFDPLIVHLSDPSQLSEYAHSIPTQALDLAQAFMPGPLTLLLPKKELIPDLVTSGSDRVALRVPAHPVTLSLLRLLTFPLAAPSANPFGYISPTTPNHVAQQLGEHIPYILDGGEASIGIESTILGFEADGPVVYRLGGLRVEDLEAIVGTVRVLSHSSSQPQTPGMLKSHYAPKKPLLIAHPQELLSHYPPQAIAWLGFDAFQPTIPLENQIVLSQRADLGEAARRLFACLRQLDALPVAVIATQLLPEIGLGRAINDRLRRASAQS
jgi:L-threonylcarbamoyladenylate synthase